MSNLVKHKSIRKPQSAPPVSRAKGLNGLVPGTEESVRIVGGGVDLGIWLIKFLIIGGVAWFVYNKFTNRFIAMKEESKYPPANVTKAQAQARADAIASSIGWFSNSFDQAVSSLSGLNYNGFVRVFNAFGTKRGTLFGGEKNLIEWLKDQFSEEEVQQLSFLTNGVFFKNQLATTLPTKIDDLDNAFFQMNDLEKQQLYIILRYYDHFTTK
ncbi:MAG: hypothetical protein RLZ77_1437 [Bacteroidota bacterium]|jgi:hypothetical protein